MKVKSSTSAQLTAYSENPTVADQRALLEHIVELDLYKILAWLQLKHAKKTIQTAGKSSLTTLLGEDVQASTTSKSSRSLTKRLTERARALQALFTVLESISDIDSGRTEAQERIAEIVKEAHELTLAVDLNEALEHFVLYPSMKESLPEALGEFGKYYSTALELVGAARYKTCRIFLTVHVEPFEILVALSVKESQEKMQLSSLTDSMAYMTKTRAEKVGHELRPRMIEITRSRKVHAEVQILFSYELYAESPQPRFICASKSVWYLCNPSF